SVHPHACGDHIRRREFELPALGSPPRVWGPRRVLLRAAAVWRFTPTRVGTTRWHGSNVSPPAVHPHACGDHEVVAMLPADSPGSPPRVWGPPLHFCIPMGSRRFTPTRVGTGE